MFGAYLSDIDSSRPTIVFKVFCCDVKLLEMYLLNWHLPHVFNMLFEKLLFLNVPILKGAVENFIEYSEEKDIFIWK